LTAVASVDDHLQVDADVSETSDLLGVLARSSRSERQDVPGRGHPADTVVAVADRHRRRPGQLEPARRQRASGAPTPRHGRVPKRHGQGGAIRIEIAILGGVWRPTQVGSDQPDWIRSLAEVDPVLADAYAADVNHQNAARSRCHQHVSTRARSGARSGILEPAIEGDVARLIDEHAFDDLLDGIDLAPVQRRRAVH
jgi:hypothetical protein